MPQLLAALRVGEAHGKLAEELFALTRAVSSRAAHWLRQAVGRREEATRFAGALARLLRDEGVTVRVVAAAGSIAGGGNPRFEVAVRGIVAEMESGADLAAALKYQPRYFDRLYCGLLEAADSRARLRACLEHLGTEL
jgi:type IV pilus assembly protein PilC